MADIEFTRKTDASFTFQYYESDGTTARALSSCTVYFTVKDNQFDSDADDSGAALATSVTSHTSAATGLTTFALTDDQLNIDPKLYFYDIRVKEADGKIYKAQSGTCRINGSPTNRIT